MRYESATSKRIALCKCFSEHCSEFTTRRPKDNSTRSALNSVSDTTTARAGLPPPPLKPGQARCCDLLRVQRPAAGKSRFCWSVVVVVATGAFLAQQDGAIPKALIATILAGMAGPSVRPPRGVVWCGVVYMALLFSRHVVRTPGLLTWTFVAFFFLFFFFTLRWFGLRQAVRSARVTS